ncbi:hypothetical protein [Burkholderia sp. MBR-1]|uniref:hypothetical protein n=1 Tax=Burkholderia sp. MBR-1 TaxID=2732364 RepID=UPI0015EEA708|nr:hypothetical protein [Burkholderia sp. MBR-1]QMI49797.1 hypothetical protein MBR110_30470 [Burkholderia sp. MBR-1]
MKPLSLDAQRNPDLHQHYQGFKNILYLAGYLRRENPHAQSVPVDATRTFWMQMTNNENLSLPVVLPAGISLPKRLKDQQGLKVHCNLRGWRSDLNDRSERPQLQAYARSFNRINVLEMPALTDFQKAVPEQAPEDKTFRPFGSGYRSSGASNHVELAGILANKYYRPADENKGAAFFGLIRQHPDPRQDIPVMYYGRLAEQLSDIPIGAPIHVTGKFRLTDVRPTDEINPVTGKPRVIAYPVIVIDVPQQPTERDILYIQEVKGSRVIWKASTPEWIFNVAPKRANRVGIQGDGAGKAPQIEKVEEGAGAPVAGPAQGVATGNLQMSEEEREELKRQLNI